MARPTKSLRLWIQCIGRGLRLYEGKKDCLFLDLAGTVAQHGYPTMRRDFNKVRPERGEQSEVEFKDMVCPHCDYSAQYRNCRKEIIETKHHITRRTYCPNCNEIIAEDVQETKEIKRLKLVEDISNVSKVSDADIGEFVTDLCAHKGYKTGWVMFVSKLYNKNKHFEYELKLLYNKRKAELCNKDTAVNNIRKLQKEYE